MAIYLRRILPKRLLELKNFISIGIKHQRAHEFLYEIPDEYQKTFYLANASLLDNIGWFFHRGVETAFKKYATKLKCFSATLNDEMIEKLAVNRIKTLDSTSNYFQMKFPLKRDSGIVEIVKALYIQHGRHFDTHLAGLRFSENIEKSHIAALSNLSSYKYVNVEVPFAGAHAAIKIDPQKYSTVELKSVINSFTKLLKRNNMINPKTNVFKPDVNCTPEIMKIFIESYKKTLPESKEKMPANTLACIMGKSLSEGGINNYEDAVTQGIMASISRYLHQDEMMLSLGLTTGWNDKTYIIKGLGNVGQRLVGKLSKEGAKCVGVIEKSAGYYNKYGIDIEDAANHMKQYGTLLNFFSINHPTNKILQEPCDIFIVASSYQTITYNLAPMLNAKMIVEAADGAFTPTAHKILLAKQILVLPDIYVNCGAAIASNLEYLRNTEDLGNNEDTPSDSGLEIDKFGTLKLISQNQDDDDSIRANILPKINVYGETLTKICNEFELGIDVRTAAYIMATQKIFDMLQDKNE